MRTMLLLAGLLFASSLALAEDEPEVQIEYIPLTPKLIVNLQGRRTYLRTDVQLMATDSDSAEKIKTHLPAVRHGLIMLISNYTADQLGTMEQREEFRKKALEQSRTILDQYASSKGLSDLLFTEFLVQ